MLWGRFSWGLRIGDWGPGIEDWGLRTKEWGEDSLRPLGPQKFCWSSQAACQIATVCASLHARSSINAVAKMYEKEEGANMFFSFDPVWPPYQAPPICPKWSKWLSGVKTLSRRLILSWWPPDMEKAEDVADKTANLTKMCKYQNAAKHGCATDSWSTYSNMC